MKCPSCGGAELEHETRDMPYTYDGETTVFAGIEGYYCPNCGESVHGAEIGDKLSRMALAFNNRGPLPDNFDAMTRLISQDDGEAARAHLAAGNPIYYREADTPPGVCVKEFSDGHRELVRFNLESGKETVVSTLTDALDSFASFGPDFMAQDREAREQSERD